MFSSRAVPILLSLIPSSPIHIAGEARSWYARALAFFPEPHIRRADGPEAPFAASEIPLCVIPARTAIARDAMAGALPSDISITPTPVSGGISIS